MSNSKLDKLYGMDLKEFANRLKKETNLTMDDIVKLMAFEIRMLKESYQNKLLQRDDPDFDISIMVEIEAAIISKKEKFNRYLEFFKPDNV